MNELMDLKKWCELQIKLLERIIEKNGWLTRFRRRWYMAEICGIQKVINKINREIDRLQKDQ